MTLVKKATREGLVRKGRARVLVVEDDAATRHLYVTALGLSGFWPIAVEDGLSALRIIEAETLAAIILDLNIPVVDGRSVLAEVQQNERTAHIPVIVVTGEDVEDAEMAAAAVRILHKPLGPNRLLSAVEDSVRAA